MYLALLFCFICPVEGPLEFTGTGIYQPFRHDEVLVTQAGHVLILDYPEAVVHHYSPDGTKLKDIGYKGQGPGGFKAPWNIYLDGQNLFVFDRGTNTISSFTIDGSFVRSVILPKQNLSLTRVHGGWAYGDWLYTAEPDKKASVVVAGEDFSNPHTLLQLEERGTSSAFNIGNDGTGVFTPVGSTPWLAASPDGKLLYVVEAKGLVIHTFDLTNKKEQALIRRSEPPVPFDKEWADKDLHEATETLHVKIKTDYPEYFPAVRQFFVDPQGHLIFDRWRGQPETHHNPLKLNAKGQEHQPYSWEAHNRCVGQVGDSVYVTSFDNNREEAIVTRIPAEALEKFVTDHPIVFDGRTGRTFNSN